MDDIGTEIADLLGEGGPVDSIRASNMDAVNREFSEKKRAERRPPSGPRTAAGKRARQADDGPSAPPPQGKRAKGATAEEAEKMRKERVAADKGFASDRGRLYRYRTGKLWATLQAACDPRVLNGPEATPAQVREKLKHIRETLGSLKSDAAIEKGLYFTCDAIDKFSDHGALFGMNITGYADEVMRSKDDIDMELEEIKAEYGDWLTMPLWARVSTFLADRARACHAKNVLMARRDANSSAPAQQEKGKEPEARPQQQQQQPQQQPQHHQQKSK